jgi:hypothetical protein
MTSPIASGWSDCRVGLAPTGKRRLFTAHTQNGHQNGSVAARYCPVLTPGGLIINWQWAVLEEPISSCAVNFTFKSINGGLKMTALSKSLAGAVIGAGILAFSAVSASAHIACVVLVCWHVQDTYEYPSESRVVVHPDDWKWGSNQKYSWREHEGRGYWKGDSWTDWK